MAVHALAEFNPFDPDFYPRHAFETYRWMRDEAPVWYSERWGWWALTRFEDVRNAILDADTFRSFEGMDIDDTETEQVGPGSLPNMDNPRHDEIRSIVQPWFLPRRIGAHADAAREVVRRHVARWSNRGSVDLAQELAWPTPFDVFFSIMGLPPEGGETRAQLERWVHELKGREPGSPHLNDVARAATAGIHAYFTELIEDRRRHRQADLASHIVHSEINGVPFTDEYVQPASEVMGLMMVLFLGGVESTAGLIATTFKLLAENPDQRRLVLADPSLIPNAIEEAARWAPPLQLTARTTWREVTLRGVTIPARRRVVLVIGAANRDERQFLDPDTFDVRRGAIRHLAFGEGVHGCLGAPLARLETRIVMEEALPILGEYELSGDPVFYPSSPDMYVWWSLPTKFVPALRKSSSTPIAVASAAQRLTREQEVGVRVASTVVVAEGVVALTVQAEDGEALPLWEPGAHIDLILPGGLARQYSLCGDPADLGAYRLGVLREAHGGGGSAYIHDRVQVGDLLRIRGPRNRFRFVLAPRYVFIAGGIGITPILPMVAAAEAAGAEWQLFYGGRQRSSMAFTEELARYGDRVTLRPQDEFGLLDLDTILSPPHPDTLVYCCGPEPLLAAVEARCVRWPARALHVERFNPKPLPADVVNETFEVVLARSGRTLVVPPDRSILSVIEDAGIVRASSCRKGTCGTCETPVLEGRPDHRDAVLDAEERAANDSMMICTSRSLDPRLVLDL